MVGDAVLRATTAAAEVIFGSRRVPSEDVVYPNVHISRRRTKVRNEPKSRWSLTWAGLSSRSMALMALIYDGCSDHKVIDRGAVGDPVCQRVLEALIPGHDSCGWCLTDCAGLAVANSFFGTT
jgi:hypothetical protein